MTSNIYLDFLRRWYWLIAIGIVIGVGATNIALASRVPLYQSTSTVQVGRTVQDSRPDPENLSITEQLVPIYRELAKRDPVLDAASATLGLPYTADSLRARMLVSQVPGAPLIDITVVDPDPRVAALVANEIARQLILQSPTDSTADETQQFIQDQLVDLQEKINLSQDEIDALEDQIAQFTSAIEVSDAQARLEALNAQVDAWQRSYATLLDSAEPSKTNFLVIVAEATPSGEPVAMPVMLYYGLGVVVGGGVAAALALGLTTLFGSVRLVDDLRRISNSVPVMTIPYMRDVRRHPLVSANAPASPTAASYRVLRNILQTEQSDAAPVSIAVFSSRPGEGKTTTVANLAVVLASVRRSVILVDANLRNPSLDQMFGTDTTRGISDVLLGDCTLAEALQPTDFPNLTILGAGSIPGSYTDILSPGRFRAVVGELTTMAEITLVDTPSILEEQEALMLAREVDAAIVIVESGRIRPNEIQRTLESLNRSGVTVVSIALSKVRASRRLAERLPFSREARLRKLAESRRAARRLTPDPDSDRAESSISLLKPLKQSKRSANHAHATADTNRSESA